MTVCVIENKLSKELPDAIADMLKMMASASTVRTYNFATLQGIEVLVSDLNQLY
jgi:hypothetical protein